MDYIIRLSYAPGNKIPVFTVPALHNELSRPFGATYDSEKSCWMYPAYFPFSKKVLSDLKALNISVSFSDAAITWIERLKEVEIALSNNALPDFSFITKPYDHQKLALAHAFYNYRAAIYYAPGLGKSKIAIDLIRLLKNTESLKTTLILGPLITVKNWGKEIDTHSGKQLSWATLLGTPKQKTKIIENVAANKTDILLLTYDTGRNFYEQILDTIDYEFVICDESHNIKSFRSIKTKTAIEIGRKAKRKLLLSGTPTLGDPRDLYGQFKFLADYIMPENLWQFENKFLVKSPFNKFIVSGYKNLDVLNSRIQDITIRKSKEECLDLPERQILDIYFDLANKQVKLYNQLILEMGANLEDYISKLIQGTSSIDIQNSAVLLNKLQQVSSGFIIKNLEEGKKEISIFDENPKLDALEELLSSILADDENKVIIWSKYKVDLEEIEKRLQVLQIKYVKVDGSTGSKSQALIDAFNTDKSYRVYLSQISTGVGITLNAASYMIYYSLDWSLGSYLQSLDRNYRIGQNKKVTVYRLLGKGTIDKNIAALLDKKLDIDNMLASKLACITCPNSVECVERGIELFDPGCLYKKQISRPVTKVATIET